MSQKEKIILVTGASSGIGKELVKQCVHDGYKVIGLARREDELRKLKSELNTTQFEYYIADVTDIPSLAKIKSELENKNSLPDIVVCAAAVFESDTNPYNAGSIRKTIEINFFGTMNVVETFLDPFLQTKQGHFIALSSIASWRPSFRGVSYPASKAAIALTFRGLNLRYAKDNICFSTIYLGPVETTMWEGKKSFLVITPQKAAREITKVFLKPRSVTYVPFLSTTLSRLSALIPDEWYVRLSAYLFK